VVGAGVEAMWDEGGEEGALGQRMIIAK
jgi:hypothetical protein